MKVREIERNPYTRLEMVELPTGELYYRVVSNYAGRIEYQDFDYHTVRKWYVVNEPRRGKI